MTAPPLGSAGEGLAYVFSFLWKPPILIAWRPREVLQLASRVQSSGACFGSG